MFATIGVEIFFLKLRVSARKLKYFGDGSDIDECSRYLDWSCLGMQTATQLNRRIAQIQEQVVIDGVSNFRKTCVGGQKLIVSGFCRFGDDDDDDEAEMVVETLAFRWSGWMEGCL